jgi:hypothetical protein
MTSLTRLEILECREHNEQCLTSLINLRHILIRGAGKDLNLKQLTNLSYLDSDHPRHFDGFNGNGLLDFADANFPVKIGLMCSVIRCRLEGKWYNGQYTGSCEIAWRNGSNVFIGQMVNGEREGNGSEIDHNDGTIFLGQWHRDLRHGIGSLYDIFYNKGQLIEREEYGIPI